MCDNPFTLHFQLVLIPLGSPKYIPPVILTIIISKPETISGLSVDASTNCLKHIAGLKFAKVLTLF